MCLLPDIWANVSRDYIENRENEIVNNHAQYCSVVKTAIGNNSIVIGGEVDAGEYDYYVVTKILTASVWNAKPEDKNQPIDWVELKTSAEISNERGQLNFERKLMKFWAQ